MSKHSKNLPKIKTKYFYIQCEGEYLHCFVNFPFPSIQHGILVAKGGQHNGGTSKHKKYISHRQHQDTARVRFGESSEFFLRLWNAAIVWATHRQNAYTCKFLFMLWSAAIVLAIRIWKTYFLWVAFLSSIEGCSFHILSFHFCFCCCAPLCTRLPLNKGQVLSYTWQHPCETRKLHRHAEIWRSTPEFLIYTALAWQASLPGGGQWGVDNRFF